MFTLSEYPCGNYSYDLCGDKSCGDSIDTASVNLFPEVDSHKCCRQDNRCIFQKCNKTCNRRLFNGFIIARYKFIPEIRYHAQCENTQCRNHLFSQFSAATSK